ncbi:class E sortase [Streptomyces sp. NBC_00249]|uniref:class E sortase n=1 Tax=Streptomyces sp. NBC_00249 TaxID=2975690 RepID=UPI002257A552|nr:class E sortase [Streptomyces sp. NBC_00249]MCX5198387.1 class E sortase [Streptomyces sp. NBC_00249]
MRDHVRVVVQGGARRGRRDGLARVLWAGAELITTLGVVVALLVVHQVWWTNRQAVAGAQERVQALEREWGAPPPVPEPVSDPVSDPGSGAGDGPVVGGGTADPGPGPEEVPGAVEGGSSVPAPGRTSAKPGPQPVPRSTAPAREEAYAVLRVPRLGLAVPVAQGVDRRSVLDKGYAGQYPGTAQPGARGNFALAGHRNTHGEPFRYINRLREGDELYVDVRGRRYVYVVGKVLSETTERDSGVIAPVPRSVVKPEYGYSEAGSYITLTTCTPEYTSKYRLVVWGTLKPVVGGSG